MKEEGRVAHATGLDRTSDARDEAKYRALTGLNPREMVLQHGRDWPKGQELARWGAPSSMVIIRRALTPVGHLAVGCYHGLRSLASPSSTLDHSLFSTNPHVDSNYGISTASSIIGKIAAGVDALVSLPG